MPIQYVNLGSYANDGTGDDLRSAFEKVNANFMQLGTGEVHNGRNVGTGVGVFSQRNNNAELEFKSLTSTTNTVNITSTTSAVDLQALTILQNDPNPRLGANLSLNGKAITGPGDVQTTVWGINIVNLNSVVSALMETSAFDLNLGTFARPVGYPGVNNRGYDFEMGFFVDPPSNNDFNFGSFLPNQD